MVSGLLVPDTVNYMIAGYVVLTIVIGIYITSIAVRWKKTAAEYSSIQEEQTK